MSGEEIQIILRSSDLQPLLKAADELHALARSGENPLISTPQYSDPKFTTITKLADHIQNGLWQDAEEGLTSPEVAVAMSRGAQLMALAIVRHLVTLDLPKNS